ncbi:hypothetical protein GIS00_12135 [Nakamurella sp. YIM 132087]|uniref:Helicase-associated domain-containing protein n=1 Tax=Nakamurella alba TaxID=2665158 RepID=A0A7K1FKM1_9ACTN|nr:helicase associated domain-containing protein [Nakamurella alba]MTD14691.1 hypothetical protein [Nakamurella alba]
MTAITDPSLVTEPVGRSNGFQLDQARWLRQLAATKEFREESGRLPRRSTDEHERRLALWLATQRREFAATALSEIRVAHLDSELPGWNSAHLSRRREASR